MEKEEETPQRPSGLRYNDGKVQMNLVSPDFVEELGRVLTFGAKKYHAFNYMNGLSWSSIIDSLERHLLEIKKGHLYDKESTLSHIGHATCNLQFLYDGIKYFPERDDLFYNRLHHKKVSFDLDETIADFCGGWCEKFGGERPTAWNFDRLIRERLEQSKKDEEFWMGLKPIFDPNDLPCEVHSYITHRVIGRELCEQWLDKHGFPVAEVIVIDSGQNKSEVAKKNGTEIFVDDSYQVFKDMHLNGISCYLFDRPHNQRFNIGHWRIKNIKNLPVYRYNGTK